MNSGDSASALKPTNGFSVISFQNEGVALNIWEGKVQDYRASKLTFFKKIIGIQARGSEGSPPPFLGSGKTYLLGRLGSTLTIFIGGM